MKLNEIFSGETSSGWYKIEGDTLTVDNSGYRETFSKDDIRKGLQTGSFHKPEEVEAMRADNFPEDQWHKFAWRIQRDVGYSVGYTIDQDWGDVEYTVPTEAIDQWIAT